MKHHNIFIVIALLVACSCLCAGPAYDKWSGRTPKAKLAPTATDYDKLIAELEQGKRELAKERDDEARKDEKTQYVSVCALRESARQLGYLRIIGSNEYFAAFYLDLSQWRAWMEKAQKLDKDAGHNIVDLNGFTLTQNDTVTRSVYELFGKE